MQNLNNIKKGVYTKLTSDTTLMALIEGVYGINVMPGKPEPYVTYFVVSSVGDDNFGNTIDWDVIQLDCYAQKSSTETAQDICGQVAAAVADVMDNATLTITGYPCAWCYRILSQEFYEESIEAHRWMLQYRIRASAPRN